MKLYPKCRPVRIKISVGGEEHSSLESLCENFKIEEIISLYENGALKKWLKQINHESLWVSLSQIEVNSDLNSCEAIIKKFFANFKESDTIGDILIFWYDNSLKINFSNLLRKLIKEPTIYLPLSIDNMVVLKEKALSSGDSYSVNLIETYCYTRLKYTMEEIGKAEKYSNSLNQSMSSLSNANNSENNTNSEYDKLLQVLKNQWGVKANSLNQFREYIIDTVKDILDNERLENILKSCKLNKIILSEDSREEVKKLSNRISLICQYIKSNDLKVESVNRNLIVYLGFDKTNSIYLFADWYSRGILQICKRLCEANNLSNLLDILSKLTEHVYLIIYSLRKKKNIGTTAQKYGPFVLKAPINILITFLDMNGGIKMIGTLGQSIAVKIVNELNRYDCIFENRVLEVALFIGILCLHISKSNKESEEYYLKKLIENGYRPAILLRGLDEPRTELEKTFLETYDVEKIPFVVRNILEL